MSLKLTLYVFISLVVSTSVSAVLFSIEDGWTETDDVYASGTDQISFVQGDVLDSRFVFEASTSVDTYCLQISGVSDRSQNVVVDGTTIGNLGIWTYYDLGADSYIQNVGGDSNTCRFYYWENKDCTGDTNDAVWLTDSGDYTTAGCAPDVIGSVDEGITDTFPTPSGSVDITCIDAIVANYVKCQAPTSGDLDDCVDDSFNGVNGGDSLRLYETCHHSDSSSAETTATCDVSDASSWEIAFLDNDHLTALKEEIYASGIPNVTFSLYAYDACGTALFDRDLVDTFSLTQFQTKGRVCSEYAYDVVGYVSGYFPWYGKNGYVQENYTYGSNTCSIGTVCTDTTPTSNNGEDLDLNACYVEPGATCYDGDRNQDETDIDYGGVCGNCSSSGKRDDIYWSVAISSERAGFFNANNPFDSDIYCQQGEDSANFVVVVVLLIGSVIFLFLIIVFGLVSFLLGAATLPFIKSLFKKRNEKE